MLKQIKAEPLKNKVFLITFWIITIYSSAKIIISNNYGIFFTLGSYYFLSDFFAYINHPPANYPPLAKIPYIIAHNIISNTDTNFAEKMSGYQYMELLKVSHHGIALGLTYILTCFLPLFSILLADIKGGIIKKNVYAYSILLSGVMLFAVDRGNIIVYSLTFLYLYLMTYKSENKYVRLFSYFCLAISANLKLYPAVFGLLMLIRKNIKGCIISGAMFFAILIISHIIVALQTDSNIIDTVDAIQNFTHSTAKKLPYDKNISAENFNKLLLYVVFRYKTPTILYSAFYYFLLAFVVIGGMFIIFFSKQEWQKLASAGFMCMFIPQISFIYVCIFIFPALVCFLNVKTDNKINIFYSVLFSFIIAVTVIYGEVVWNPMGFVVKCFSAYIMFTTMFVENFVKLKDWKKLCYQKLHLK